MSEFQLYVIRERRLRKVFASIKGYYYQADLGGNLVTWLCPHRFTQALPAEVIPPGLARQHGGCAGTLALIGLAQE